MKKGKGSVKKGTRARKNGVRVIQKPHLRSTIPIARIRKAVREVSQAFQEGRLPSQQAGG